MSVGYRPVVVGLACMRNSVQSRTTPIPSNTKRGEGEGKEDGREENLVARISKYWVRRIKRVWSIF